MDVVDIVEEPAPREALEKIKKLPTLPSVLTQILHTASDPEASALDLGRHIAADQALSSSVLRIVNSAYYGFFRTITSITEAIVILGFVEVRNIVLTAKAFDAFPEDGSPYDRIQLWRHSLATAMAADRCAKMLKLPHKDAYFVSGLLHDFGKVALDTLYPERFRRAVQHAQERKQALRETEREEFGLDHALFGGLLGEHWNLPDTIVDAIRLHHSDAAARHDDRAVPVTAAANYLTYLAGLGESCNGGPPSEPRAVLDVLGVNDGLIKHFVGEMDAARDRIDALIGALPDDAD